MTNRSTMAGCVLLVMLGSASIVSAREQPAAERSDVVSLSVQVTISRHRGDDLVSSLPYVLSVISDELATLRVGADVPVRTVAGQTANQPFDYRHVGTNISCEAAWLSDDRYRLTINIDETSVYGDDQIVAGTDDGMFRGVPVFRSFQSGNSLVLRLGDSVEYTVAADRISGESVRVEVALTVLE